MLASAKDERPCEIDLCRALTQHLELCEATYNQAPSLHRSCKVTTYYPILLQQLTHTSYPRYQFQVLDPSFTLPSGVLPPFLLRHSLKLRKLWEHDWLVSFIFDKDVAGWFDERIEGSQGHHEGSVPQDLVGEGSTVAARVSRDCFGTLVLGELVISLGDLKVFWHPHSQLHGGTRLFFADGAVTPTRQGRISYHLACKLSAHARPSTSLQRQNEYKVSKICEK